MCDPVEENHAAENQNVKPRRSSRLFVLDKLALIGTLVTAATLLGFAGSSWWGLELFAHFRVQYAVLLLLLVVVAAALKRRRQALVFAVPLLVNLATILPIYLPPPPEGALLESTRVDSVATVALRLLHFNVHTANTEHERVLDYLLAAEVDLIFLQEFNARWMNHLVAQRRWKVASADIREDNFGIVMLVPNRDNSPLSVGPTKIIRLDDEREQIPSIDTTVTTSGGTIRLLYTHPLPPVKSDYASRHTRQLGLMAKWSNSISGPAIILGDFNTTHWGHAFGKLMADTALINSQRGHGIGATWPTGALTLIRIPIDHCLHSPHLRTVTRRVGPDLGSDHRPLLIELAWAQPDNPREVDEVSGE